MASEPDPRTLGRLMPRGSGERVRIGLTIGAIFFVLGLHVPYFPVWLTSRGLTAEQVGWVLALGTWTRVLANPIVGHLADRTGRPRRIGIGLAVGTVAAYAALTDATSLTALIVGSIVLGMGFSPLIPLTDAIAVRVVGHQGGYGRLRRWGSATFIAASVVGGLTLEQKDEARIVWALLGASVLLTATMVLLPRGAGAAPRRAVAAVPSSEPPRRTVAWFLLTVTILHGAHAMLNAFGTEHWRAQGVEASTIGWLWAVGVIAEILFFTAGMQLSDRYRPATLLAFAGAGGVVRWSVLATTSALVPLFSAQVLHALTFASLHLGAMEFIRRTMPEGSMARATTSYSAASGVALGLGLPLAGLLYGTYQGHGYWAMTIVSALGLGAALRLRRL